MLEAVVDHNALRPLFRGGILSVHAAGIFKPAPVVYRLAEERLGVPRAMLGFVSSNGWDAAGAKSFGFQAFWINRGKAPVERLGVRPDATISDLSELPALLG
jgi:2-haloacid dehalogenase